MSAADEPPGGDPDKTKKQAEAILRQRALGRELRAIFNQYADEPVPPTFDDLLDRLEKDEAGPANGEQTPPGASPSGKSAAGRSEP
ncbi:MAG: hypothetical protein JNJ73_14585 [Hyphomonadaceae bacterium]|nr:hypothetical protein [Hyphomonadaceae bacterium]